jgi:AraC-like DNA-binding protein
MITDFDLWYIVAGRGAAKIDGRWIDFAAGDLLTLKPGQRYQEERGDRGDPFTLYFVHVLPFGRRPGAMDRRLAGRWPLRMSLVAEGRLPALFADLFETYTTSPEGSALALKAAMLRILEIVFAALRHRGGDAPLPPAHERFVRAREFIREHHAQPLLLDEIAEHADLSASYLLALFRRYAGTTPISYQADLRVRSAKLLLARGLTVTEVARRTGFQSLHYFSRVFRKRAGLAPSQFAELCRRK